MSITRRVRLAAATAFLCVGGGLTAQETGLTDYCVAFYTGENHSRIIGNNSTIRVECDGDIHSAPFGNWGVTSNFGKVADSNQFPGWKRGRAWRTREEIWQWNSCTGSSGIKYGRGSARYYNGDSDSPKDYQYSTRGIASPGNRVYRKPIPCEGSSAEPLPSSNGCKFAFRSWTQPTNFMSLYELDWNGNSLVTTLYYPSITVSLNCDYYGCSEGVSDWQDVSSTTNPVSDVYAQLRMKVYAGYETGCGWE